ncbi:MAG: dihydrodipicolinate synthase family protein [Verrucomicrobiales bacterium]|nr:dihydrodipicolinate synthase family protein [Verrucomicrobiales bacterium]
MKTQPSKKKLRGTVTPLVTPVTGAGELDEAALERLLDLQLKANVEGVFVLGTTGEGASVPRNWRMRMVQRTVNYVQRRALVYAGITDTSLADAIAAANEYFRAGVDVVVAPPPVYFPINGRELLAWYTKLLDSVDGPVVIYNIPATTRVSIPLDLFGSLVGHPRLAGVKDSENSQTRHQQLIERFSSEPDFSILIGIGSLMLHGLKLGADGIVPSVANLIPEVCHRLCEFARHGDWAAAEAMDKQMASVAEIYQKGRTLGESLAALKAMLALRGVCTPAVLPPLLPVEDAELEHLRTEMQKHGLLR